jgi:SAM-dependent methyltransferase
MSRRTVGGPDTGARVTAEPGAGDSGWRSYWDVLPERKIFAVEAADYVVRLAGSVGLDRAARVLDFGGGFGFVARLLAPRVGRLAVWDASAHMRRAARQRVAGLRNVRVLEEPGPAAAGERYDLILVNSVVQYMTPAEFDAWLVSWRSLLTPGGRIVLSDVITTREPEPLRELVEFVLLGARRGVLLRTLWEGLSALRGYTRTRRERPLSRIDVAELTARAATLGLKVETLRRNLAYRSGRSTVVLSAPIVEAPR